MQIKGEYLLVLLYIHIAILNALKACVHQPGLFYLYVIPALRKRESSGTGVTTYHTKVSGNQPDNK